MKPRKVVVTMELWTDMPLKDLKSKMNYDIDPGHNFVEIEQIQANVIKDDD